MNNHLLNDIDPDGNNFDELVDLNECSYYNIDNFASNFIKRKGNFNVLNFNIRSFF